MIHLFDTEVAERYGVNAAVLLQNIGFWVKTNEANQVNFFDGTYWTFNSRRAFRELFPYMSERQILTALDKLITDGVLITGNYNKLAYDRTLWYALTKKGKCILHFDTMDDVKMSNGNSQNVRPIPDINTNINTNINKDIGKPSRRFTPPTLQQVKDYCNERKNNVDAQKFYDYFTASNWVDSKGNKVRNWKQKIITWEAHQPNKNDGVCFNQNQTAYPY